MTHREKIRDKAMQQKFTPEQYGLFAKLVHAICDFEDAVAERERIRWQPYDDWNPEEPTYEALDDKVTTARHAVVDETIELMTSSDKLKILARMLCASREAHLLAAVQTGATIKH